MTTYEPRLSVRAQATETVPPDSAHLSGAVRTVAADKSPPWPRRPVPSRR